jgi:glycosyltransferase involved in cell wall biosynthesis
MAELTPISVTILTKDSSGTLARCLEAVASFDEVIILDNGSTDDTLEIAATFPNVKIFHSDFIGFGPLKNLAASHARNDLIFTVDSDEIVSEMLAGSVLSADLEADQVGQVLRVNYYRGRKINGAGWQNDVVLRLYDRRHTHYHHFQVHESIVTENCRTVRLAGSIRHEPYKSVSELVAKMQFYSTLYAEDNRGRKTSSPAKAVFRGVARFFRDYVFKKGFLYGSAGLAIAWTNAAGVFYKYLKLYEANQKP